MTERSKPKETNRNQRGSLKLYQAVTLSAYALALLVCLICNLALERTLSWFYIVLCSILIAFSAANLPFLLRKYRLMTASLAATLSLYLLLYACSAYTGGGWLYAYGYPIATFSVIFVLLLILVIQLRVNWFFRSSLLSLLTGIYTVTLNVWIDVVLAGDTGSFQRYFRSQFHSDGSSYIINGIIALCLFAYALIGFVLGISRSLKNRR